LQTYKYNYLFELQFLGFRYSGWQKMPGQKTVEGMLFKTLKFIWKHEDFKIFGSGRTDSRVSAEQFYVQVFSNEIIEKDFISELNYNLPRDIKVLSSRIASPKFNLLANSLGKTYRYSIGKTTNRNVFESPTKTYFKWELNWPLFIQALRCFQGELNYKSFTVKASNSKRFVRQVEVTWDETEQDIHIYFKSQGFLRYQIRLMIGACVLVAKKELSLLSLQSMLENGNGLVKYIAPGSGLSLVQVSINQAEIDGRK